jgi:hypothetical protein
MVLHWCPRSMWPASALFFIFLKYFPCTFCTCA